MGDLEAEQKTEKLIGPHKRTVNKEKVRLPREKHACPPHVGYSSLFWDPAQLFK